MPHRNRRVDLILALALLLPGAAAAEVFRCVGDDGQIAFSQTPCPPKVSAKAAPPPVPAVEVEAPAESELAAAAYRPPAQKKLAPAVAEARARAAEAHEEQKRRQCETNLRAQIDSIDAQMRGALPTPRTEALKKKRSALQARLDAC